MFRVACGEAVDRGAGGRMLCKQGDGSKDFAVAVHVHQRTVIVASRTFSIRGEDVPICVRKTLLPTAPLIRGEQVAR
jgi:hypothetical protein